MTTRKHNEFLDIARSDEDEASVRGYDSEEHVMGTKGRPMKKRRTDTQDFFGLESDKDESADEDEVEESRSEVKGKTRKQSKVKKPEAASEEDEDEDEDEAENEGAYLEVTKSSPNSSSKEKTKSGKLLSTKPLKAPKKDKTGVVYLSSLPPYLKPFALKNLLETRGFGPITKLFLSPLVPNNSSTPRRSNKRKLYSEGWIEFESKKTARITAETLNSRIIGGKKGSFYHDDIWNMKYLRGFRWADLMETMQRERSERESKQRIADMRARKEEKAFLAGVEAGRVADGMARKNEEKRKRKAEADGQGEAADAAPRKSAPVRRRFVQNDVVSATGKDEKAIGNDAKRVLGKIF
ncbi:Pre-rRNA-processing protein esf2 [Penicillium canariense]|uniref:Pre-rRNA-processing protein ESF2 n=1 Tax=Penicillium canariense TaxID=189055 RepID=A0A9W9HWQ1_9EURO|nr:Pre-rRNA-processing protein esf2 [Penicillium canariense]KAJ5159624.1 Pre-rRNA-processing protein esf2 [Penicillium canariense]